MTAAPEATLAPDGESIHMRRGSWEIEFPVEDLRRWLGFFRRLRDRRRGVYAQHYAPSVAELERIEREVLARAG